MTDDKLRDQVAKAVCSIAIGSERVETVMEIIQEHTAKAELRAGALSYDAAEVVDQAHRQRHQREGGGA